MTTRNLSRTLVATAFALVAFGEGRALADAACATVDRSNVVSCALAANHGVRADEHGVEAARARYVAASPIFPSNPTLSLMGARRSTGDQVVPNWSVTLAQEIEIAGQRGKRRDEADEQIRSAQSRLVVSERDVAAVALRAWFDALASRSELELAQRLEANAKAVATAARARADKGLVPTVEADVAEAAALRAMQARLDAEQHATDAKSALASLVGRAPSDGVTASGDLVPLPAQATTAEARPEVAELDARRRAFEERASLLRRSRVPNVTVSTFVQNDALNDRLVGFGLSIPIPLPHPVGRTYAGEIAEAEAEAARARSEAARITRDIELRRALATSAYETSRTKLAAYTPDRVANAERQLGTIAQEVEAGRLAPRDAFVTEQALVDLLQAHVEAERSLCLASVELARASGVPLESR
ncbi:MAG TPA: TolC family protein [Labilithrix sp.]